MEVQKLNQSLSAAHKKTNKKKHGTFMPLVFTCFGGMGRECKG